MLNAFKNKQPIRVYPASNNHTSSRHIYYLPGIYARTFPPNNKAVAGAIL